MTLMALKVGTRLGPYEVLAPIGVGGMGEVYRARDTKLGRDVALKVLPDAFARDKARVDRFRREAKILASLNHPNIAGIYGLEESDGVSAIVLELVEGPTLAERIAEGPISWEEALAIFRQIAEALEAAHEQGIVHRDLKPANVKVREDGTVKVLDFGLAKGLAGSDLLAADASQSPTLTKDTALGVIVGTASYMSPEQARGKSVDKRSDNWAFGCCLYEALTGKKAFDGDSVTDILAAVVHHSPDWSALPVTTPSRVQELLRRMLERDVKQRLRDIGDGRIEMNAAVAEPVGVPTASRDTVSILPLFAAALLGAFLAGVTLWMSRPSSDPTGVPMHLAVTLPPDQVIAETDAGWFTGENPIALSPDSSGLVYAARHAGTTRLYLRSWDEAEARAIPGTEGAQAPFFSPDGESLGFFARGELRKVSLEGGGSPFTICAVLFARSAASWGADDTIVFASSLISGLTRVPASGGELQTLTTPNVENGEFSHLAPDILPDGTNILYTIAATGGSSVAVFSIETGESRVLLPRAAGAKYVSTGHLVYANARGLWGVGFDVARLEVTGAPVSILEGVLALGSVGVTHAAFAISETGLLAYVPRGTGVNDVPVWVDREGNASFLTEDRGFFVHARLSPDGERLAVARQDDEAQWDIWIYDTARGTRIRLTTTGSNFDSAWKPDGARIFFNSTRDGQGIYSRTPDGSGGAQAFLRSNSSYLNLGSWSPDGTTLAFVQTDPVATGADIWTVREDGDGIASPLLATEFDEIAPEFSPDGRSLAYVSNESGRNEVYVVEYPSLESKTTMSFGGGVEPAWSPTGTELFYRNGNQMLAADVASSDKPRVLFDRPYRLSPFPIAGYDVAPDGRRFVMMSIDESADARQINVVVNWFEDLKRLVPSED